MMMMMIIIIITFLKNAPTFGTEIGFLGQAAKQKKTFLDYSNPSVVRTNVSNFFCIFDRQKVKKILSINRLIN